MILAEDGASTFGRQYFHFGHFDIAIPKVHAGSFDIDCAQGIANPAFREEIVSITCRVPRSALLAREGNRTIAHLGTVRRAYSRRPSTSPWQNAMICRMPTGCRHNMKHRLNDQIMRGYLPTRHPKKMALRTYFLTYSLDLIVSFRVPPVGRRWWISPAPGVYSR
jgi:hypothetical protein